jgi:hypothetical protein
MRAAHDAVDAAIVRALLHHAERLAPAETDMVLRQATEVARRDRATR